MKNLKNFIIDIMKAEEVYKAPFYRTYSKVFCNGHKMAFDFIIKDELTQLRIINVLNGGFSLNDVKGYSDFYYDNETGKIAAKSQEINGYIPIILIRGWGYLTGIGGLNLDTDTAVKIQAEFGNWIIQKLNKN